VWQGKQLAVQTTPAQEKDAGTQSAMLATVRCQHAGSNAARHPVLLAVLPL